jgi:hypothetical protein
LVWAQLAVRLAAGATLARAAEVREASPLAARAKAGRRRPATVRTHVTERATAVLAWLPTFRSVWPDTRGATALGVVMGGTATGGGREAYCAGTRVAGVVGGGAAEGSTGREGARDVRCAGTTGGGGSAPNGTLMSPPMPRVGWDERIGGGAGGGGSGPCCEGRL